MRGVFHAAQHGLIRDVSQIRESKVASFPQGGSPAGRNPADLMADEAAFMRVDLPMGWGGVEPTFDQAESLSDFANAEYRLMLAEAAA